MPLDHEVTADDIRPMPFTHIAFLDKVTGVSWLRLIVRYMLNKQTTADEEMVDNLKDLAKEKYLPSSMLSDGQQTIVNYFYDGLELHVIGVGHQDNGGIFFDQSAMTDSLWQSLPRPEMTLDT
ncbi:hypothetical protein H7R52_07300 [Weissella confusa]|uniref:Uncharacterized protein n=1 Tax=Weissella confusa TaxID=1583 RepID=A0A923NIS7_WEICO|nr:hypothetical protein [Weissella confusa]